MNNNVYCSLVPFLGDPSARYAFRIAHAHTCPSMHPSPHRANNVGYVYLEFSKIIFTSYEEWGWENCQHCRARVATATHTMLQFYPTKITSSSAASGRPLKRKWPIRENTHDDLRKCFTNNTTSKSAGKKKVTIQTNYLNTTAKTKFQKTIRN